MEEQEKENGSHPSAANSWELKVEKTRRGDRGPTGSIPPTRTCRGQPGGPEKQAEALGKDAKIQECEKGLSIHPCTQKEPFSVFDSHICTERRLWEETDLNSKIRVFAWEGCGLSRWSHFRIQTVAGYGYSKNEVETEDAEHILQLAAGSENAENH